MTHTTNRKSPAPSKVPGAFQNTNIVDFPTAEQKSNAIANQIARLALAGHTVHRGGEGDFIVCKYGLTRYCADFAELAAFAVKLGVKP